jgi:hypothetical protein
MEAARSSRLNRTAGVGLLAGGAALVVDVTVIIAINRSFGIADDALFLGGLILLVGGALLSVAVVASRWNGGRRVLAALAGLVAVAATIGLVTVLGDAVAQAVISTGNHGHTEGGVLANGIVWFALGALLLRKRMIPYPAAATA